MSQRSILGIRKTSAIVAAFTLSTVPACSVFGQTDQGIRLTARFLDQPSPSDKPQPPEAPTVEVTSETSLMNPVVAPESAQPAKGRIALPPITTPNLSLANIGTGQTPEDWVSGRLPEPTVLPYGPDRQVELFAQGKAWVAPVFCHQPLYFEDTMLERHGHEKFPKLTPVLSGARFYTTAFLNPYLAVLRPPLRDITNAGHYRPGSAAPGIRERAPYDPTALRLQLLTVGTLAIP